MAWQGRLPGRPQTLGWSTHRRQPAIKRTALAIALVIVVGFLVPPFAILFRLTG